MKNTNNIIPFPQPEPENPEPWPTGFEGMVLDAQLATDIAFGECIEQLEIVKTADYFERHGDGRRASNMRTVAARKAEGVVEGLIEAQVYLEKARREAIRKLQEMRGRIPAGNEKLDRAAAAMIDWSEDKPAEELLEPCRVIAEWLKTAAPETGAENPMTALDTRRFNGSDLRRRARIHGASLEFLERTAHLLCPPLPARPA